MDLRSLPTDVEAPGMMEMLELLQPLLRQQAGPAEGERERPRPPLDTCFSVDEFVRPGPSSQGHRVEDAAADWNTPAAPDGGEPADWKTRGILNTVKEGDDDEIRRLRGLVDPRLHGAARAQDVEALCELLAAGAAPAALDWEGRTPLHLCVAHRLMAPLMVLLSVPGSADVRDASGWPLLHAALLHGWRDGARAILDAGFRLDASGPKIDLFDLSPIHYEANRYPRVNFLKFLESLPRTAIEVAIITDMAMLEPILAVAKESGVVDCLNILGHTALRTAVCLNNRMAVEALLRSGASPHRVSDKNDSVLHTAVDNPQMVMYFLEKTDVKSSLNDAGQTPEHIAVNCRELETLKLLFGKLKDIRMKTGDREQNTLLHLAAIRGDDEIAQIILYRDAELEQAAGLALALRMEREAAEREAAEQNAGTRDAAERETAEQDAGTGDAAERETAEQDAGTGDAAERETAEQDAGTGDAAERETAEQDVGTRDAAGRETAEQNSGTRDAPEQNAAERVSVEQNPAEVDPLERVDFLFEVNAHGETPLHLAAKHNNKKLAALFLLNGANLSTQTENENKTTVFKLISNNFYKAESFFENIFDGFIYNENMFGTMSVNLDYGVLAKGLPLGMSQIKVLEEFVNCDQSKLLIHPLIQSLLYLKWKHFQPLFFILLCIYGLFLLSFNGFIIYVFYFDISKNSTNTTSSMNASLATDVEAGSGGTHGGVYWLLIVLTYVAILILLFQESMFIYLKRWSYFPSWETVVKLPGLALCAVTPLLAALVSGPWPRHIACAALLLAWLQAMFLVSRISRWGYYVLMFGKVAFNILKILVIALFLVIAFTFSFVIQYRATAPFDGPFSAFVKTLVMMSSEFDYGGLLGTDHDDVLNESRTATRILFVIFVIFVAIVFMNFMTGVAVSDINDLNETGKIKRAEKRVELLSTFEPLAYDGVLAKWFIKLFGDKKYHSSMSTERGHNSTWCVKVRKYPYKAENASYDIQIQSSKLFNAIMETPSKQDQADKEAAKNNTEKPYRSQLNLLYNKKKAKPRGAYERSDYDGRVQGRHNLFESIMLKGQLGNLVSDSSKMSYDIEALKRRNVILNTQIGDLSGVSNDILKSMRRGRDRDWTALARMTRRRRRCAARSGQRLD